MKAVIIAAGRGKRMKEVSAELPKCLAVRWEGRSLFDRQVEAFRSAGIDDIVAVRGYQGEKFDRTDVRYVWNREYASNNILGSLMCAREEIRGDVLVSYSDIWFEPAVVSALIDSPGTISVAVDAEWKAVYEGRSEHPLGEAEVAEAGPDLRLRRIGKIFKAGTEVLGEFIGMMRLRPDGAELFRSRYGEAERLYAGKPFVRAAEFRQAYLTDMLQYLTDAGTEITCCRIRGGWREIDTVQDYENFLNRFACPSKSIRGENS